MLRDHFSCEMIPCPDNEATVQDGLAALLWAHPAGVVAAPHRPCRVIGPGGGAIHIMHVCTYGHAGFGCGHVPAPGSQADAANWRQGAKPQRATHNSFSGRPSPPSPPPPPLPLPSPVAMAMTLSVKKLYVPHVRVCLHAVGSRAESTPRCAAVAAVRPFPLSTDCRTHTHVHAHTARTRQRPGSARVGTSPHQRVSRPRGCGMWA